MGPHERLPFIPMYECELSQGQKMPDELWQMWHRLYRVVLFTTQKEAIVLPMISEIFVSEASVTITINHHAYGIIHVRIINQTSWVIEASTSIEFEKVRLIFF